MSGDNFSPFLFEQGLEFSCSGYDDDRTLLCQDHVDDHDVPEEEHTCLGLPSSADDEEDWWRSADFPNETEEIALYSSISSPHGDEGSSTSEEVLDCKLVLSDEEDEGHQKNKIIMMMSPTEAYFLLEPPTMRMQ